MKRFQRPINEYTGSDELLYRDKYQQDSKSVPKIAISSSKMDGDFNYLVDAINTLDEDIKSVVYSGIANETILSEHISDGAVSESKMAEASVASKAIKDGAVTNAKLTDLAVTTPKLANNSVTKDKISSDSVGTAELIDGSITKDKLADDAISDSVPVGTIAQFSAESLPTGWILCSGATVSKNTYPQLVKFLTGSDTTLEATLPSIAEADGIKFAIKAFSDVAELATLDIAGLTQDVADNNAAIANKASGYADAIAVGAIAGSGSISYSKNVNMVTKTGTGNYKIYLDDSLKGKSFDVQVTTGGWGYALAYVYDYVNATFEVITSLGGSTGNNYDASFNFRIYEREGE